MKARIVIYGQIKGNSILKTRCETPDSITTNRNNGGFNINFSTKKQAIKALSNAYRYLKSDKENWSSASGSYLRGDCISYDASRAVITTKIADN